ncbi:MAG: rod shape-determining protein RodA [Myxococcales bacterium]|nr:rod shape-determining protein RodA [Myxococcales bacterium]MCB9567228.1 rod shape-determining protein RodA [Myxococcales bacterium]MCB9704281.1 rod shape-determining protein RodA [Myxococcales bacterium]
MSRLGAPPTRMGRLLRSIDWVVVTLAIGIVALALINLNSASSSAWSGKVQTQMRWIGLGTIAATIVAALDYRVLYRLAYPAYAFGVGLLALVPLVGIMRNEARRWLGFGEFQFQPSELMKVLLLLALARYLQDRGGEKRHRSRIRQLLVPALLVGVPVSLIIVQPDLSTSIICVLLTMSLLALGELSVKEMTGIAITGLVTMVLGWGFFMLDYQRSRIDVWLNPEAYADNKGYQTIQAMIAVGDGGFVGRGVSQGTQNVLHFLPYRDTDFPFAVFAEEWGYLGTSMVLIMFLCLVMWCLNIASQARDRFSAHLCVGIAALFFWHILINVGMVLQLLPVTGVTLPFFSLGGSNALTMMIGIGILLSVSRSRRERA